MDREELDLSETVDPAHIFTTIVDENSAGVRFDHFLVHNFPEQSRARIIASIRDGGFTVDGEVRKSSYKLKLGQHVSGAILEQSQIDIIPEKIDFPILFEDDDLLAISKPPGLVVHPGSGNSRGTLVNGLVHYYSALKAVGDGQRPGIVHRLDKDTSGVMLVAKNDFCHRKLVEMFKERAIEKEYIALLHGAMDDWEGRIVAAIGRHPVSRQKMSVREIGGKYAASSWEVLAVTESFSLVKVKIETGRTHQIRVHMAHLGYPVAGDEVYGNRKDNTPFTRQMLHAWRLQFHHPVTGRKMRFIAPLWPDFTTTVNDLFPEGCYEGELPL